MSSSSDPAQTGAALPSKAMHIGEVATRTELSLRSLRHWDEVGLLRPSGRSGGGFRLYTEDDVERILLIRRMKPLGFTLEEMVEVMRRIEVLSSRHAALPASARDDGDADTDAREHLSATLDEAYARRDKLRKQLSMADEFIVLLTRQLGRDPLTVSSPRPGGH